jgi:hypothetical protein
VLLTSARSSCTRAMPGNKNKVLLRRVVNRHHESVMLRCSLMLPCLHACVLMAWCLIHAGTSCGVQTLMLRTPKQRTAISGECRNCLRGSNILSDPQRM